MKGPATTDKTSVRLFRFLLAHSKIYLIVLCRDALFGYHQSSSITVALVLAIDEDKKSKTRCNVTFRCQVDAEFDLLGGDGNECLDLTVAVTGTIFSELCTCATKLDRAG